MQPANVAFPGGVAVRAYRFVRHVPRFTCQRLYAWGICRVSYSTATRKRVMWKIELDLILFCVYSEKQVTNL